MDLSTNTEVAFEDSLWADPEYVEAYWQTFLADLERRGIPGEDVDGEFAETMPFDPIEQAVALARQARSLSSRTDAAFAAVLADAARSPEQWVGPDPTLDPLWRDPSGLSNAAVRARRRDLAVRSAALDLGARTQLSDLQVRSRAHKAKTLEERCPRLWRAAVDGAISEQNVAAAAHAADTLPADARDAWERFDEVAADAAQRLAPGRFRQRVRTIRDRAHPESREERHARAAADRDVRFHGDDDGMVCVTAFIPASFGRLAEERLDATARHLASQTDETRTTAQLRADVFCDLLVHGGSDQVPTERDEPAFPAATVTTTVHLTIPVLTLLGAGDAPATLDGYGPIDQDTARTLAAGASEWYRVLTDPVRGTVLDVERRAYRVPRALRRWLTARHPYCLAPGCTRPSRLCDIDHRIRWADGGATAASNLGPLCERHHSVKDGTPWAMNRDDEGRLSWTSPTGFELDADPPPF
ncbi:HNH endonuclease signature motif containing protein [Microbacterium telephonicum]|uniref:Uncharacterized protein DUF222 n=1 Tax=Microbacterium telephonicum TaxID=1714841 RepID=A0A498C474_9MICO|nr:HNH endonuclease signature motif containing protein [Microbacterium telephonicum]RLK47361.1 uncharacterized protein DUF222 [Microbacterium telephonicum]